MNHTGIRKFFHLFLKHSFILFAHQSVAITVRGNRRKILRIFNCNSAPVYIHLNIGRKSHIYGTAGVQNTHFNYVTAKSTILQAGIVYRYIWLGSFIINPHIFRKFILVGRLSRCKQGAWIKTAEFHHRINDQKQHRRRNRHCEERAKADLCNPSVNLTLNLPLQAFVLHNIPFRQITQAFCQFIKILHDLSPPTTS